MKITKGKRLYSAGELKGILTELLTEELAFCSYKIDASFEAINSKSLFRIRFHKNLVRIWINMDTVSKLLRQSEILYMVGLHYCTFFISNYIMCVKDAFDRMPESYCDGLIIFNAIYDYNCGKNLRICAPLMCEAQPNGKCRLRPLEMKCDIDALMRIRIQFQAKLSAEQKNILDKKIDERMLYLGLPEAAYENLLLPRYALYGSIAEISQICEKCTDILSDYKILDGLRDIRNVNLTVEDLISIYKKTNHSFYIEMLLRIVCGMRKRYCADDFAEIKEALLSHVDKYRNNSVDYCTQINNFTSKILNDNLLMILKLVNKMNRFIENEERLTKSGTVHSIYY